VRRCSAALEMPATAWQANAKLKLSTMDYQLLANVTAADAESDEPLVLPLEEAWATAEVNLASVSR
jgi:hypothetical protein